MTKIKNEAELYRKLAAKAEDKYNSDIGLTFDPNLYQKIVHSDSRYAPQPHMKTVEQYISQCKMLESIGLDKSTRAHVDAPSGTWYTHRSPLGCFMCEDQQFITTLISVLEYLGKRYPHLLLRPTS